VKGGEDLPLLIVPVGGGEVAVPLEDVEEIIASPQVVRAEEEDRLEGRGLAYRDLGAALGLPETGAPVRALVVGGVAFGVPGSGRVVAASDAGLRPLPAFLSTLVERGVLGVAAGEGGAIPVLDIRRLV
jgi:hypothetical protein